MLKTKQQTATTITTTTTISIIALITTTTATTLTKSPLQQPHSYHYHLPCPSPLSCRKSRASSTCLPYTAQSLSLIGVVFSLVYLVREMPWGLAWWIWSRTLPWKDIVHYILHVTPLYFYYCTPLQLFLCRILDTNFHFLHLQSFHAVYIAVFFFAGCFLQTQIFLCRIFCTVPGNMFIHKGKFSTNIEHSGGKLVFLTWGNHGRMTHTPASVATLLTDATMYGCCQHNTHRKQISVL